MKKGLRGEVPKLKEREEAEAKVKHQTKNKYYFGTRHRSAT